MRRLLSGLALAFTFAVLAASAAKAQRHYDAQQLAKVDEVYVRVETSAGDDCQARPDAFKVNAEQILRRYGIKVLAERKFTAHKLDISPTRFVWPRAPGICVANLEIELWRFEDRRDGTGGRVPGSYYSSVLSGSRETFQQRLGERIDREVTALANEILKARGL